MSQVSSPRHSLSFVADTVAGEFFSLQDRLELGAVRRAGRRQVRQSHTRGVSYVTMLCMTVTVRGDSQPRTARGPGGRPRIPGLTNRILEATIALAAEGGIEDLTLDITQVAEPGRPGGVRQLKLTDP